MWGYVEIVAAVVAVGLALRLHRRVKALEESVRGYEEGAQARSDRLDVHAMKAGLMTRGQVEVIRSKIPADPAQWDKAALEIERHGVADRESNLDLH